MRKNSPHDRTRRPIKRGFTLVELLVVIAILAITAKLALDAIANTDAGMRADRAAREAVVALRYARTMSITYGGSYGVEFDTTNNRFQVFQSTGSNVVNQPLTAAGTYVINLSNPELAGTTMTAAIANDAANPYDVVFAPLGSTANNGTVVFSYAGRQRTVTIPKVGDPTIN